MQRFINEAMDVASDVEGASGQYSEPGNNQYTTAAYGFASDTNEYIAIDQTLDASTSFPAADNKLLQGITLADQNEHPMAMHTNGGIGAHNDTASGRNVSLNAPSKRKSPEGHTESAPMSGDSKRKRSKVSRACDQCRKKKIRCDADAEGSNQLSTCSNCQKSGQICEYSRIPQKRGPSKGYIKELSERVQQVEGQLALQNSTSYRSSLDGQLGAFDSPFSPEDDGTYKNRNSFSQQRGPFADFTRDRFPSVGGWNSGSLTSNPRQQSIAVPPDQVGPSHEKPTSSASLKPFWSDWIESPTKKRNDSSAAETSNIDRAIFQDYSLIIHSLCPILPDEEQATCEVIALASVGYQNALYDVLSRIKPSSTVNWQGLDSLSEFINEKAREPFSSRSDIDSLLLVWIELLLLVIMQHNTLSWDNQTLPECDLVRMSLDQCDNFFRMKTYTSDLQNETAWLRAAYVSTMLARLYAISRGESSDPVPGSIRRQLNINVRVLPPRAIFLVQMTDSLQSCLSLLPEPGGTPSRNNIQEWARMHSSNLRAWLNAAGLAMDDSIVAEVRAFGELLSLRCNTSLGRSRPAVVGPAVNLAEAIRLSAATEYEANNGKYIFNPLSLHTITLATLTLLELLQCDFDDPTSGALVGDATQEMRQALSAMVEKGTQIPSSINCKFWASVLLGMVDERLKAHSTPATHGRKGEEEKVSDLTLLLLQGYVMPLVGYADRQPES